LMPQASWPDLHEPKTLVYWVFALPDAKKESMPWIRSCVRGILFEKTFKKDRPELQLVVSFLLVLITTGTAITTTTCSVVLGDDRSTDSFDLLVLLLDLFGICLRI